MGRDGNGDYRIGDVVHLNEEVRPVRFAKRRGIVTQVHRTVPKKIADAIHAAGKTTNNGDFEIGLDFSDPDALAALEVEAWFLPRELGPVARASERRPKKGPASRQDRSGQAERSAVGIAAPNPQDAS